jgi:hypothetical protein
VKSNPALPLRSGLAALRWISLGHGYEITAGDVLEAYTAVITAAYSADISIQHAKEDIRDMVSGSQPNNKFVLAVLEHHLS